MTIRLKKYRPKRPIEIIIEENDSVMQELFNVVQELCNKYDLNYSEIFNELSCCDKENTLALFDYYFGDDVTIYR